jgi:hypothetical protein
MAFGRGRFSLLISFTTSDLPWWWAKGQIENSGDRRAMLIQCPECRARVSDNAVSCPKCGFRFDPLTLASLRETNERSKRLALTIIAAFCLCIWLIMAVVFWSEPNTGHHSDSGESQDEAYHKFQKGEPMSNGDVNALADRPQYVSPEQEKSAGSYFFNCCTMTVGLPGAAIVIYLFATRNNLN